MSYLSYLLVISTVVCGISAQNSQSACTTPRNERGECVSLRQCPPLVRLLQRRPIPNDILVFLRRSTCGFDGNTPRVCCALSTVSNPNPQPTLPPIRGPNPVDTSGNDPSANHPSFRLLPPRRECGIPAEAQRIIGGREVRLGALPWMALLGYTRSSSSPVEWLCGGSLINERYVMTAAHCISPNITLKTIRLGEHTISNSGPDCFSPTSCAPAPQDMEIEEIIVHKSYNDPARYRNDIALIRLRKPVKTNSYVRPICLPLAEFRQMDLERLAKGQAYFVAGWGRTTNNRNAATNSDVLQAVEVPAFSLPRCSEVYERSVQLSDTQVCAGGLEGKDSCSGDSGGPLMLYTIPANSPAKFFQVGVVSIGPVTCGSANQPGIYTRVSKYIDWILANIKP